MIIVNLKLISAVLSFALMLASVGTTALAWLLMEVGVEKRVPVQVPPPKLELAPPGGGSPEIKSLKDGPPPKAEPPKGDSKLLQGVWDVSEIETMAMPQKGGGATVTFDGENYVFQQGDTTLLKAEFKLDEAFNPRRIDLFHFPQKSLLSTHPLLATPTLGVYKLDGNKLTLALGLLANSPEAQGLRNPGRPTSFQTGPGTAAMVLRLVRQNPAKQNKPAGQKLTLGQRWTGFYGTEHNHVRLVIRDEMQWAAVWAKSMGAKPETPVSPEPQPLVKVDFKKNMVLAVFMGDRENGGHVVDITRVVTTDDGCKVYVREHSPPPGGEPKVTQQPFCLVVIPRVEGKMEFVNEDGPPAQP
jgi:uncharacterized protein (TIGR03067 family)